MPRTLNLLGPPEAIVDGRPVAPRENLTTALLLYLAGRDGWVHRDQLVDAIWPGTDPQRSRLNLRQLLHRARRVPWAEGLETTASRVRFPVESDLAAFRRAIDREAWDAAVELYRGPFLDGANLGGVAEFETWHSAAQQELRGLWSEALRRRAAGLAAVGELHHAARLLARGLEHDPLSEGLLGAYMAASYAAGERERALLAYDAFRENLQAELGLEPLEETERLAAAIARADPVAALVEPVLGATLGSHAAVVGEAPAPSVAAGGGGERPPTGAAHDPVRPVMPIARPPLPVPATPFVGRRDELAALERCLFADDRLVTINGFGGVGKSRLALAFAEAHRGAFADGAAFVSLAGVDAASLPVAAARGLGFAVHDGVPPGPHVLAYLEVRELLLVLDDAEHLTGAAEWIDRVVAAASGVRILVTSRRPLGLRAERVFPLDGLETATEPAPPAEAGGGGTEPPAMGDARADAAELFVRCARRADTRFQPEAGARVAIDRICRRVAGVPLAIELAAAWSPLMSVAAIEDALEPSLELVADAPDATGAVGDPARHAGLRSVFEHSWALLAPAERRAVAAVSVFRGGFTAGAAEQVAGVRPSALLGLLRTSLLRRTETDRFGLHPLVADFAGERLRGEAGAAERTAAAHAEHYLTEVAEREDDLSGDAHNAALAWFRAEWPNVRAAWSAACAGRRRDLLERAEHAVGRFLVLGCDYEAGRAIYSEMAAAFEDAPATHAVAEARRAAFVAFLGDLDESETVLRRCLAAETEATERVFILRRLASALHQRGRHSASRDALREALELCERQPGNEEHTGVLYALSVNAWALGDYDAATDHAEACLARATRVRDREFRGRSLAFLGMIANAQGRFERAKRLLGESLPLLEDLEAWVPFGFVQTALGYADWHTDAYPAALPRFRLAYALFGELGHAFYYAISACGMGETLRVLEGPEAARPYFREGLATAYEHSITNYMLIAIHGFAELLAPEDPVGAAELLSFVRDHPAVWRMDRENADRRLATLGLPDDQLEAAARRASAWELERVAVRLLHG